MKSTRDKIYDYVKACKQRGFTPSQVAIAAEVGLKSPWNVGYHISRDKRLVRCGLRCIEIVEDEVEELTYTPTTTDRIMCKFVDALGMNRERYNQLRAYAETIEPYTPPPTAAPDDEEAPQYMFGATGHTGSLAYLCEIIESRRFDRAHYKRTQPPQTDRELVRAFADLFDAVEPETPEEIEAGKGAK